MVGSGSTPIGYLIFLYAPIILLPMFAFNDGTIIAFPLSGFTTKWFGEMLADPTLSRAVKNSLIIAVTSSILATTLGVFAARASTRFDFPFKGGIMGLIMLPLVLPEIIVAVSLAGGAAGPWRQPVDLYGDPGACADLYALCHRHSVLGVSNVWIDRWKKRPMILGETPFSTFRLIILPLVMPGIISSLLISFTISLDEFIIAFFLAGTEPTLPVYIFSQFRFPKAVPVIMALGTMLVLPVDHPCLPLLKSSAVAASRNRAARIPEASCDR